MKKFLKNNWQLILIILAGFLLRVILLDKYPPSLNWDEVSHGYNAYSILKTGKDEWGELLPLANFRAYGDYPLPLNLYLTIPFVWVLGLTEFSIRLPHAILGTLTLISIYYLIYSITKNKNMSLVASFIASISPWYFFTSRFVIQSNLSVFFLISSLALFFNRSKNRWFLPFSLLFLGLTLFSYHTTRIFSPLLLVVLIIIYRKELFNYLKYRKKIFLISVAILAIFFLPLPIILVGPEARARSSAVFILNDAGVNQIIADRNASNLPENIKRLVYNRPIYFIEQFSKNYINYFSPQFLFFEGGTQYQFSIPGVGLIYWINLPLFYLGLAILIKNAFARLKRNEEHKLYQSLLAWLILSPIPASITTETSAVLRATTMLPLPEILITLGMIGILKFLKKYKVDIVLISVIYFAGILILAAHYLNIYFTSYAHNYSWVWQYGYKQAVEYAKQNYDQYDAIIITKKYGEPHEYVLFYNQWNPDEYRNDANLIRFNQSNWYWVDRFDKYWFLNDWQIKDLVTESKQRLDCHDKHCLLITSPGNFPEGWTKLDTFSYLDSKPAFEIYENK